MSIGIDKRVQVNRIVESQLPEFVRSDFPLAVDFFKTILSFARISRWFN